MEGLGFCFVHNKKKRKLSEAEIAMLAAGAVIGLTVAIVIWALATR